MHTTEYKILNSYQQDTLTVQMNEYAAKGWEAVSLSVSNTVNQSVFYVLMKKEITPFVPEFLTTEALHGEVNISTSNNP